MAKKKTAVIAISDISKSHVEEFFKIDGKRRAAQRQAESLAKQLEPFKQQFQAWVEKHGGKSKTVILHGVRISLETVDGSPKWKIEYIKLAGDKAADKVMASTPSRIALKIERVS